eukprot:CAMPEP_0119136568 /NCGR_PEP_ID=MMETSP1310-20130426/21709_1 /TAXON_ID=464262 /ORGANISM="Genus nov. species nov., Strain RCC2339" /LENGTH=76 /DNA_ID=CAMNT_0007127571 /DNA_START=80 /DNA_END=310 /DNA_ORIENTATION=-
MADDQVVYLHELVVQGGFIATRPMGERSIAQTPIGKVESLTRDLHGDIDEKTALDATKSYEENGVPPGSNVYVFLE